MLTWVLHSVESLSFLEHAPRVASLVVSSNNLADLDGIASCPELFNVDASRNRLQSVSQLARFEALGIVNLAYNQLNIDNIMELRNVVIMELSIAGNQKIDAIADSRQLIILALPLLWILNGTFISREEREEAKAYFQSSKSKLSLCRSRAETILQGSIEAPPDAAGRLRGEIATDLLSHFAKEASSSIFTDQLRLRYFLKQLIQEEMTRRRTPAGLQQVQHCRSIIPRLPRCNLDFDGKSLFLSQPNPSRAAGTPASAWKQPGSQRAQSGSRWAVGLSLVSEPQGLSQADAEGERDGVGRNITTTSGHSGGEGKILSGRPQTPVGRPEFPPANPIPGMPESSSSSSSSSTAAAAAAAATSTTSTSGVESEKWYGMTPSGRGNALILLAAHAAFAIPQPLLLQSLVHQMQHGQIRREDSRAFAEAIVLAFRTAAVRILNDLFNICRHDREMGFFASSVDEDALGEMIPLLEGQSWRANIVPTIGRGSSGHTKGGRSAKSVKSGKSTKSAKIKSASSKVADENDENSAYPCSIPRNALLLLLQSPLFDDHLTQVLPIVHATRSESALDLISQLRSHQHERSNSAVSSVSSTPSRRVLSPPLSRPDSGAEMTHLTSVWKLDNGSSAEYYSVRPPIPGEMVLIESAFFTAIEEVTPQGMICLAAWPGAKKEDTRIKRAHLIWIPRGVRGYWKLRSAYDQHPQTVQAHYQQERRRINKLSGFSFNNSWVSNFVLASQDYVLQENERNADFGIPGGWSSVVETPWVLYTGNDQYIMPHDYGLAPFISSVDKVLGKRWLREQRKKQERAASRTALASQYAGSRGSDLEMDTDEDAPAEVVPSEVFQLTELLQTEPEQPEPGHETEKGGIDAAAAENENENDAANKEGASGANSPLTYGGQSPRLESDAEYPPLTARSELSEPEDEVFQQMALPPQRKAGTNNAWYQVGAKPVFRVPQYAPTYNVATRPPVTASTQSFTGGSSLERIPGGLDAQLIHSHSSVSVPMSNFAMGGDRQIAGMLNSGGGADFVSANISAHRHKKFTSVLGSRSVEKSFPGLPFFGGEDHDVVVEKDGRSSGTGPIKSQSLPQREREVVGRQPKPSTSSLRQDVLPQTPPTHKMNMAGKRPTSAASVRSTTSSQLSTASSTKAFTTTMRKDTFNLSGRSVSQQPSNRQAKLPRSSSVLNRSLVK